MSFISSLEWSIIDYVRGLGKVTKNEISQGLNIPYLKVNTTINNLKRNGFLIVSDSDTGLRGRQPEMVFINPKKFYFLGIAIGANGIRTRLLDFDFRPVEVKVQKENIGNNLTEMKNNLKKVITSFINGTKKEILDKIVAYCIAFPGAINREESIVINAPGISFLENDRIEDLVKSTGIELLSSIPMCIDHNAKCAAYAEKFVGGAGYRMRKDKDFVVVLLGRGMSTGLILNNQIYRGHANLSSEFGRILIPIDSSRNNFVSLEAELNNCWKKPASKDVYSNTIEDIEEYINLEKLGDTLALGMSYILSLLNPAKIVFTGWLARYKNNFYTYYNSAIAKYGWTIQKVPVDESIIDKNEKYGDVVSVGAAIDAYYIFQEQNTCF